MSMPLALRPSRLRAFDVIRTGALGLRTRRLRTGLSTLGVAIGIAAMVAVLGLSASSQEELRAQIRQLGTNLLQVQAGQGFGRGSGELPDTAVAMVSRIAPVTGVSSIATVDATVRRTDTISEGITGGISVFAADGDLLDTLRPGSPTASSSTTPRARTRPPCSARWPHKRSASPTSPTACASISAISGSP